MHIDYRHFDPAATSNEVIHVLQNGGLDADGFSAYRWQKRLAENEVAMEIVDYIVKNRTNPSVSPMFDMIVAAIKDMLDE
jgi:nucleoside-specific outer membrane channel protein Tsx